jgi:hypothetical protein
VCDFNHENKYEGELYRLKTRSERRLRGHCITHANASTCIPALRKRHVGDTQAPVTTRTSGVGASARSLVYADGVPLSALIGNNNRRGGITGKPLNTDSSKNIQMPSTSNWPTCSGYHPSA